ncbi:MAG TPA: hypothetical protein VLT59_02280 [Steroidobacteraceae bacterium]|nr:hypothetical protein [Steroidobacteraceae bacterium]
MLEIEKSALLDEAVERALTTSHLVQAPMTVDIGSLLVVGFPLGFHGSLHHIRVVGHAVVASSFGMRLEGRGYFLTDVRTHRGTSGAPVVLRTRYPDSSPAGCHGCCSVRISRGSIRGAATVTLTRDRG